MGDVLGWHTTGVEKVENVDARRHPGLGGGWEPHLAASHSQGSLLGGVTWNRGSRRSLCCWCFEGRSLGGGRALVPAVQTIWWDSGHPQQEESITAEGFTLCREAGAGRWLGLEA